MTAQNLRPHYQRLCAIRNEFKALRTNTAQQLTVSTPSQVYAMARVGEDVQSDGVVLAAFNLSGNERDETLTLTPADWGMDTGVWYATDLMTGETMEFSTGRAQQPSDRDGRVGQSPVVVGPVHSHSARS